VTLAGFALVALLALLFVAVVDRDDGRDDDA
jgi:hypothetical protein